MIKFTNVKYYVGGGKVSFRIRKNQNYTIYVCLDRQKFLLNLSEEELINRLYNLTRGRVAPSKDTKVKIYGKDTNS